MRKILIIIAAVAFVAAGCQQKKEEYKAADGSVQAVRQGEKWTLTGRDGNELVADYDSMRVAEVGEDGHPTTIYYYKDGRQMVFQYYTGMILRCRGDIVGGQREGLWQYFFENGNLQAEATYVNGREEGEKRVYRENGLPYYIGRYSNGMPVGTMEFYDEEGNLAGTKEF